MATPTTLLEHAAQERDADLAALARAEAELATAESDRRAAAATLAAAAEARRMREMRIRALRAELATSTVPAEAAERLAEITGLVIEQRTLQARLLALEEAVADARARSEGAAAAARRGASERTASEALLARSRAEHGRRQALRDAAAGAPLSGLAAAAADALGGERFAEAEARWEALPEKVRATVTSRLEVEAALGDGALSDLESATDLLAGEQAGGAGLAGTALEQRLTFSRAEAALTGLVQRGPARLASALQQLEQVAASALLTEAEAEALEEPGLVAAGESAADLGIARDEARKVVEEKRAALFEITLEKQAAAPGEDVSGEQEVADAEAELEQALADLEAAENDFEAERDALAGWLAIVPDHAWRRARAFLEARAVLAELSGADPAALVGELDAAEEALAGALHDAARHRRALALLGEAQQLAGARLAARSAARDVRLFSAVRGDA